MAGWDTAVAAEVAILRDLPVAHVISDISAIGIQVGEQLGVRNICRRFDSDRIAAIKAQYGPSIFITCGKSADLNNIQIDNYDVTIFAPRGISITATGNATVVQLPIETFDTHNYLAASDIIIAKAGWGTISEALLSKRNLVLIEREGVLENIEELKRRGVAVSIKETDLVRIDMQATRELVDENIVIENLDAYQNAVAEILREL